MYPVHSLATPIPVARAEQFVRQSRRTGEMLIKTSWVRSFPSLFSSLLRFLLLVFPHLLPATVKERLSSLAGPGGARPPNDI